MKSKKRANSESCYSLLLYGEYSVLYRTIDLALLMAIVPLMKEYCSSTFFQSSRITFLFIFSSIIFLHSHFHFIINVIVVCIMSSSPRSLSNDFASLDVTRQTASLQPFKSGSSLAKSVPTAKGGETHVLCSFFDFICVKCAQQLNAFILYIQCVHRR